MKIGPKVHGNNFRRTRLKLFLDLVDKIAKATGGPIRVLDIGGTREYWTSMADMWNDRQIHFTLINLGAPVEDDTQFSSRPGNACDLSEYADNSFDIVHSNSVIEHVGHWPQMMDMAHEVRRLAPHYYLQTPNFWFPLEPHYRTFFFQMYPETIRARMLMKKRRGFRGPVPTLDDAMRNIQDVNLLTAAQMKTLFPDAHLVRERLILLTKSLIAIR